MQAIWNTVKAYILNYIGTAAFKKAVASFLKKAIEYIFKTTVGGGVQIWLINFFVKNVMIKKAFQPAIKNAFIEVEYIYDVVDGNILIKKKDKAKDENNQNDYNDSIRDILS